MKKASTKTRKAKVITSKQAIEFLTAKMEKLRSIGPGYNTLSLEAMAYSEDGICSVVFRAYNQHSKHSPAYADIDEAITWIANQTKGRRQSEMVRQEADELIRQAQQLEAQGL